MSGLLVKSHGDHEGEPRGAELARAGRRLPGHPRRRRADPRLRRAGPRRDLRGRGPLRPRRLRGAAADGRADRRSSAACPAPTLPALRSAGSSAAGRAGRGPRPRTCRPGPTSPPTTRCPTPPFWGTRVVKGIPLADYAACWTSGATFMGQWGLKPARASDGPIVRGAGRDRGPAAAAGAGWTGSRPRGCSRPPSSTATSRASSEGDDLIVLRRGRRSRAAPGSPSRASAATGACAWPTSSGPRSPARSTCVGFQLVTMGPRIAEVDRRAVRRRRLPRLPRAARAVGAAHRGAGRVLARAGARRARLRRRGPGPTPRTSST